MRLESVKKLLVYIMICFFSVVIIIHILSAFNKKEINNDVENSFSYEGNNIPLGSSTDIQLLEDIGDYSFLNGGPIKGTIPSIWPTEKGYISSPYGYRATIFTKSKPFHSGLDISAPYSTKIYATGDGVVIYAGFRGAYGNCVIVAHSYKYTTWYGHCSKLLVEKGMRVTTGQTIALVGATGQATGSHLHYEVRYDNITRNPIEYMGSRK